MSDNSAILAGFTREVLAHSDGADLHLWIEPSADLEDRFKAYDADECEWVWVNGWMFSVEDVEPDTDEMPVPTYWASAFNHRPQV